MLDYLSLRTQQPSARTWRVTGLLAAVAISSAFAAPLASAQTPTLPLCPAGLEQVTTTAPSSARDSRSYTATIKLVGTGVTAVDVELVSAAGTTTETFPLDAAGEVEIVRSTPTVGKSFALNFSWVQNAGQPSACRNYDRYREIPIVPEKAKLGDPNGGRFEGRYRIAKRNDSSRPTWAARPNCDLFACRTTVRSTGGLAGSFSYDGDEDSGGEYVLEQRYRLGFCQIEYVGGRTVRWTSFAYRTVKLRPSKVVDGIATELRGSERWENEIPSDETGVCETEATTVSRVVATRTASR